MAKYRNPYTPEERKAWGEAKKLERQAREQAEAQAWEHSVKILPELEGSDAQIAWATVIRCNILRNSVGCIKAEFFGENWEELLKGENEYYTSAIAYIRDWALPLINQKNAKWWIDNRELDGLDAQYTLANWNDVLTASLAQAAKDDKIAEIKARKPARPECLNKAFAESPKGSSWNLKVYGSVKNNNLRIYIADKEFPLTKDEAAELENYVQAKDVWKKELDSAKNA